MLQYFLGPFRLHHLDEEAHKEQIKQKLKMPHKNKSPKDNFLVEMISLFHLPAADILKQRLLHYSKICFTV